MLPLVFLILARVNNGIIIIIIIIIIIKSVFHKPPIERAYVGYGKFLT